MAIFSTAISDEALLKKVNNKHKYVLIIGCHSCMNESLAFVNGLPIEHRDNKDSNNTKYPAVEEECKRIKKVLQSADVASDIHVIKSGANIGCIIDLNSKIYDLPIEPKHDGILLLSCPSGYPGIKSQTDLPVYIISKQIGMVSYTYADDGIERTIIEGKVYKF